MPLLHCNDDSQLTVEKGHELPSADLYAMSVHPRLSDVLFRRAMCSDVPNAMPLLFCAKSRNLSPSLRIEESGEKY